MREKRRLEELQRRKDSARVKPFIAMDGEAVNAKYVLLQDSEGEEIYNAQGLGTIETFEWFFQRMEDTQHLKPIFVGFGFSYDCNMIFKDIDDATLLAIMQPDEADYVAWEDYEILYIPKKLLKLRRRWEDDEGGSGRDEFVLYDTLTFFGTSFLKAIEDFLGKDVKDLDVIKQGKEERGKFTDLEFIRKYNLRECEILVDLMNCLRSIFEDQGFNLRSWHGPGAVADFVLGKKGHDVHEDYPKYDEDEIPLGLALAWDCSYFGGRIENFVVGTVQNVYSYDINSAYPKASSLLPTLGWAREWKFYDLGKSNKMKTAQMAVYYVSWSLTDAECLVGPLPWRQETTGKISFPRMGEGWYWGVEVSAARALYGKKIKVHKCWIDESDSKPSKLCTIIPAFYTQRLRLKAMGDPSEYAIKIFLNSCYGKFCQRKGKRPYYCLPWGGWITAYTRAQLLLAVSGNSKNVIAFATDSVSSRVPLELPLSKKLGEWKEEFHAKGTWLMNGFYKLSGDDQVKIATRGVPHKFEWSDLIKQLNKKGKVTIKQRMFITHNLALHFPKRWGPHRLQFVDDVEKTMDPFTPGKRIFAGKKLKNWETDSLSSLPVNGIPYPSAPSSDNFKNETLVELLKQGFAEMESEEISE